jgi:hypothetical protein
MVGRRILSPVKSASFSRLGPGKFALPVNLGTGTHFTDTALDMALTDCGRSRDRHPNQFQRHRACYNSAHGVRTVST